MNKIPTERAADILIVTGDIDALAQVRHSMRQVKFKNRVHHVGDAIEARAYMRREGPYLLAPTPGLIIVDTNLPVNSVVDLVTELRTNPQFSGIALVALVDAETELHQFDNRVFDIDGHIRKPFDFEALVRAAMRIDTLSFVLIQSPCAR